MLRVEAQTGNPFEIRVHRKQTTTNTVNKSAGTPIKQRNSAPSNLTKQAQGKVGISDNPFEKDRFGKGTVVVTSPASKREKVLGSPHRSTGGKLRSFVPERSAGNDYMFWVLTFLLLVLSIIINLNRTVLGMIYRAVTNESYLNNLALTSNPQTKVILLLYYTLYLINLSIFLYLTTQLWYGWSGVPWLLRCIAGVVVAYTLYQGALLLLGWIYPIKKEVSLYLFNIRVFESALGLLLLVVNFAIAFTPHEMAEMLVKVGIGLIVMFYLMRLSRGFFLSYRFLMTNAFHFILYLCAFEIAPFLILYKWAQGLG